MKFRVTVNPELEFVYIVEAENAQQAASSVAKSMELSKLVKKLPVSKAKIDASAIEAGGDPTDIGSLTPFTYENTREHHSRTHRFKAEKA